MARLPSARRGVHDRRAGGLGLHLGGPLVRGAHLALVDRRPRARPFGLRRLTARRRRAGVAAVCRVELLFRLRLAAGALLLVQVLAHLVGEGMHAGLLALVLLAGFLLGARLGLDFFFRAHGKRAFAFGSARDLDFFARLLAPRHALGRAGCGLRLLLRLLLARRRLLGAGRRLVGKRLRDRLGDGGRGLAGRRTLRVVEGDDAGVAALFQLRGCSGLGSQESPNRLVRLSCGYGSFGVRAIRLATG